MPDLHVRNVPAKLYKTLRARAQAQRRSLSAETIVILEDALDRPKAARPSMAELLERARIIRESTKLSADWPGSLELLREDRAR